MEECKVGVLQDSCIHSRMADARPSWYSLDMRERLTMSSIFVLLYQLAPQTPDLTAATTRLTADRK